MLFFALPVALTLLAVADVRARLVPRWVIPAAVLFLLAGFVPATAAGIGQLLLGLTARCTGLASHPRRCQSCLLQVPLAPTGTPINRDQIGRESAPSWLFCATDARITASQRGTPNRRACNDR